MKKIILKVEGMSCDHCVKSITKAVGELPGVETVEVNLTNKTVTVKYDSTKIEDDTIKLEIEEQGYEISE